MRSSKLLSVLLASLVFVFSIGRVAHAQLFEIAGERALGMGGAFVAVADDATAVHWNPAGLVAGAPVGMTIGWYRFQSGNPDALAVAGPVRQSGSLTSLGTWPLGFSYGRFETAVLSQGAGDDLEIRTLRTRHFGATVLQSVVDGVIVGATGRYVRGGVATGLSTAATVGDALERAGDMEISTKGAFDLDVGVLVDMERLRVGATWKNLRSPTFGADAATAVTFPRQLRMGVAVLPTRGLTLAMDLDLDTVDLQGSVRRMFALGGEGQLGRRLAVRSGLRRNLEQSGSLVGAVGLSVSVRSGFWIDGHYAQGRRDEAREFGVALRAGL